MAVPRNAFRHSLRKLYDWLDSSNASTTEAGTVKQAVAQPDSTASTVAELVTDFNTLLQNLRDAGIIAGS